MKWVDIVPLGWAAFRLGESESSMRLRIQAEKPNWARKNRRGWYEIDRPSFLEWLAVYKERR